MAGAPALFKTNDDLKKSVNEYFIWINGDFDMVTKYDAEENEYQEKVYTREPEPPTITGLALYLGFESRQSLYDYEKKGEFSYTIKNARLRVENGYEKALHGRNATGAIFALKNFGWKDKTEVDTNLTLKGSISPNKWLEDNSNK